MNDNSLYYQVNGNNYRIRLYLLVVVASLIVALISGTFAYFQASAVNNTTITGKIADVGVTLNVSKLTTSGTAPSSTVMIPYNLISSAGVLDVTTTTGIPKALSSGCVDSSQYSVCDVFKIEVKANSPVVLDGYLNIRKKNAEANIPNVKWALLGPKGTTNASNIQNITSSVYNTSTYLKAGNVKSASNTTTGTDVMFTNVGSSSYKGITFNTMSSYYYIMVWLEDIEDNQEDSGNYQGVVTFKAYSDAGDTQGKVTAKFS